MYRLEEQPYIPEDDIETVHVYVYDKELEPRFPFTKKEILHRIVQVLAIALLAAFCLIPDSPAYIIKTVIVPAKMLPLVEITANAPIIPTGVKNYAATEAQGTLTLYNGSFLAQALPDGFIVTTKSGLEVQISESVIIPAANPPSLGEVSVSAHALTAGESGNIGAYAIDETYGSTLYIKNLSSFTGGTDAYSIPYATAEDVQKAGNTAKGDVEGEYASHRYPGLLQKPCTEHVSTRGTTVLATLACQYVTYVSPKQAQVLSAKVEGTIVVLEVKTSVLTQ